MNDSTSARSDADIPQEIVDKILGAVRVGITFTSSSIFEEKLTVQEVVDLITALDQDEAIALCAEWNRLNTLLLFQYGTWQRLTAYQNQIIDELLPPNAQMRAQSAFEDEDFVSPFSEISILALVALLCRYASRAGESLDTRNGRRKLFRALLALQEGIFPSNFLDLPVPAQFPFAFRITLANVSSQNVWAYDMGRLHALLTVPEVAMNLNGMTVQEWFLKRLGVDGADYECIANIFLGSAYYRADYSTLPTGAPVLYQKMKPLLTLSTTTPESVVAGLNDQKQPEPQELWETTSFSDVLLVRPMLRLGERLICTSTRNLFNKLHRGLPY